MKGPTHQRRDSHGFAESRTSALRHASAYLHPPVQTIIDVEPQHCFDAIAVISLDWFEVCPIDLCSGVTIGDAHRQRSNVVSHTAVWADLSWLELMDCDIPLKLTAI